MTSPSQPLAPGLGHRLALFAGDIKIQHTVFAMPWALLSAALAGRTFPGSFNAGKLELIVLCMVTARTVAMSANRLLDAEIDARNPRTAARALPSGRLSRPFVRAMLGICSILFVASTAVFQLAYRNPWPPMLAIPVLVYLYGYPFLKRFTRWCHFYLGAALGLAPLCAWLAICGQLAWPPVLMFGAVLCWTAGFDIIYACQDFQFDIESGLHSVPAKSGIAKALWISRLTHAASATLILLLWHVVPQFHWLYGIGAVVAIVLLACEQSLVSPTDLSKANLAFFTLNGIVSVLLGTLGIIDLFV